MTTDYSIYTLKYETKINEYLVANSIQFEFLPIDSNSIIKWSTFLIDDENITVDVGINELSATGLFFSVDIEDDKHMQFNQFDEFMQYFMEVVR